MQNAFSYQLSEYDCAPTCFNNALSYFLKREEIPVTVLKNIGKFTLDCLDKTTIIGHCGTTINGLKKLVKKLNKSHLKLNISILENNNVNLKNIRNSIDKKGCIMLLTNLEGVKHYILITKYDNDYIYTFDPYKLNNAYFENKPIIKAINKFYNRKLHRLPYQLRPRKA